MVNITNLILFDLPVLVTFFPTPFLLFFYFFLNIFIILSSSAILHIIENQYEIKSHGSLSGIDILLSVGISLIITVIRGYITKNFWEIAIFFLVAIGNMIIIYFINTFSDLHYQKEKKLVEETIKTEKIP